MSYTPAEWVRSVGWQWASVTAWVFAGAPVLAGGTPWGTAGKGRGRTVGEDVGWRQGDRLPVEGGVRVLCFSRRGRGGLVLAHGGGGSGGEGCSGE